MDDFLGDQLAALRRKGLGRELCTIEGAQGRQIVIDGKLILNFCSNNYLGLAGDPRLVQAAVAAMQEQGVGAGASRLVCGNFPAHRRLEEQLARFKGTEKGVVFSTGYMANVGIISGLFGRDDIIFSDRLNHASIIDGIQLSRAEMRRYPHNDTAALEAMLRQAGGRRKKIIITDSVFSMDGDIAPLDRIVKLARDYECLVMVDEAHAVGVLGAQGRGAVEHFGLQDKINIQMGTLSKAVGAFGAYCCGSADLVDLLVNKARSFIYTTGIPPGIAAAALRGIELIEQEPSLRQRLWDNTHYARQGLQRLGFDTLRSQTPILPILVGDSARAVRFSQELFARGLLVSAIRPPTVPENSARLRMTITAEHRREDIDYALKQMEDAGKKLCLI